MAAIILDSLADTTRFARSLTSALCRHANPPLLLSGELGCGKTELVRQICRFYPGAEEAEVSSPSFTICNLYPGQPPILHCDLYRCGRQAPEEALEFMDTKGGQIIVEWSEYLQPRPLEFLDISFRLINNARQLDFHAQGVDAQAALADILGDRAN